MSKNKVFNFNETKLIERAKKIALKSLVAKKKA
jgi:hypothetical protein